LAITSRGETMLQKTFALAQQRCSRREQAPGAGVQLEYQGDLATAAHEGKTMTYSIYATAADAAGWYNVLKNLQTLFAAVEAFLRAIHLCSGPGRDVSRIEAELTRLHGPKPIALTRACQQASCLRRSAIDFDVSC